jgi:hypothetical protein
VLSLFPGHGTYFIQYVCGFLSLAEFFGAHDDTFTRQSPAIEILKEGKKVLAGENLDQLNLDQLNFVQLILINEYDLEINVAGLIFSKPLGLKSRDLIRGTVNVCLVNLAEIPEEATLICWLK